HNPKEADQSRTENLPGTIVIAIGRGPSTPQADSLANQPAALRITVSLKCSKTTLAAKLMRRHWLRLDGNTYCMSASFRKSSSCAEWRGSGWMARNSCIEFSF